MTTASPLPAHRRPLPRLGLVWVTWRQHRFALYGLLAMLAGFAALMVAGGLRARSTYHRLGLGGCASFAGGRCEQLRMELFGWYPQQLPFLFLLLLPAAFGAFFGGPLIARELETGTYRFAWTQGAGRTRWLLTKLLLIAVVLAAVAEAYGALYTWYNAPLDHVMRFGFNDYLGFELGGVVFPVQTLLAFTAGVFAGALTRRTLVAVGAVFLGSSGLIMALVFKLRQYYMTPLVTAGRTGPRDWVIGRAYVDPSGHLLDTSDSHLLYMKYLAQLPMSGDPRSSVSYRDWLLARHYTIVTTYHPAGRFWTFQFIEAGWMGLLILLLGLATVRLVRRRIG
ncbi:ABC transporter permease [Actinoallomurus liliacearum]|uniref:ABC transporter permease n=1 Tax=Actinoallomurus liliacearum TaxID=1080073 RepID=A0ABP8TFI7_9ACTN